MSTRAITTTKQVEYPFAIHLPHVGKVNIARAKKFPTTGWLQKASGSRVGKPGYGVRTAIIIKVCKKKIK